MRRGKRQIGRLILIVAAAAVMYHIAKPPEVPEHADIAIMRQEAQRRALQ